MTTHQRRVVAETMMAAAAADVGQEVADVDVGQVADVDVDQVVVADVGQVVVADVGQLVVEEVGQVVAETAVDVEGQMGHTVVGVVVVADRT